MSVDPKNLAPVAHRALRFVTSPATLAAGRIADRDDRLPGDLLARAVDLGLATLRLPPDLGGAGMTMSEYVEVIEAIGQGPGALRVFLHGQNVKWELLARFGSEAQRAAYLPTFARGEWAVSFAITEPDRGSGLDVGTTACRCDGGWTLNGHKHLVSHAAGSQVWVVLAKTDERQVSCFLVPSATPGARAVALAPSMGTRGLSLARIDFDSCVVADDALLGGLGEGMRVASSFLNVSRTALAASAVGCAQRAVDLSLRHACTRTTFGRPLADRQLVQSMLADMEERVRAARALVRDAARLIDLDEPVTVAAAVAKRFAARAVGEVTDIALRLAGGIGYTSETEIERLYRDARSYWFEEGTHEVQALLIARSLIGASSEAAKVDES